MAEKLFYVYDLPYKPRKELCQILDADRRWEELGGIYMSVDVTTLTLIGQAIQREKSPTWELLNLLGERNGKIKQLFAMLARMDYQRGMKILMPYVDEKYHKYVRDGNTTGKKHSRNEPNDLSTSLFSSSLISQSQSGATCSYLPSAVKSHKEKIEAVSTRSKLTNDVLNMNQEFTSFTLQSKLNSLNHPNLSQKHDSKKQLPEMRNLKPDSPNCVESVTDNCVSEKIKNIRQMSQPSDAPNDKVVACSPGADTPLLDISLPDVMKISYDDIKKATDDFEKSRILGRGGFGAVYRGEWKGISVAIKRLMPKEGRDSVSRHLVSLKQSLNELTVLKSCRFDHILSLYGVSLDGVEPCLIYQLMVNGSLEDRLLCRKSTPPLTWSQRSNIAECTAKGLNYLHTTPGKPLVHGDIKSANILLDNNMEAKIGDFGLTREGPGCQDTHVKVSKLHGTECYLPPEYLRHRQLSPQVDVFSYGIVLLEIATGLRPYDNKRENYKLLVDHVMCCRNSGRLDSLRDPKAGEMNMMWFGELMRVGQECSHKEKKKRPAMQHVLESFNKIKEEISMMDRVRKLSNDRGSLSDTSKMKQLSPRERQMLYDICKEKYGISSINETPTQNVHSPPKYSTAHWASTAVVEWQCTNPVPEVNVIPNTNEAQSENVECSCVNEMHQIPKPPAIVQSSLLQASNNSSLSSNSTEQGSNGQAPMPLVTALLQGNMSSDQSLSSSLSKTSMSVHDHEDNTSSCGSSEDSEM